jgi:threonyl-tRNA synthetase
MSDQDKEQQLYAMRHSLAHIMATAIQELYPKAKFGIGPVVENGFYYDVDLPESLTPEDLDKIESKMHEIVKANYKFEHSEMELDEAISYFKDKKQDYKLDLLEDLKKHGTTVAKDIDRTQLGLEEGSKVDEVSIYTDGPFTDLCRGPHVESTGKVGAFKLMRVSGAYWRGDQKNPQLQRVYGVGFTTKEELKEHLRMLEEAQKRDHRKIGKDMNIFMLSDVVGQGLPLWMPAGETIKHTLMEYMRRKEERLGYRYVSTPVLTGEELYKRSGHAKFYADDMYSLEDREGNKFYLKPMNCPHHHMIFEQMVQSYRDLPLKLAEASGLYRHELSGTLTGLIRVRGAITQNDAHIYVEPKDVKDEFIKVLQLFKEVYAETGITDYWYRLSLPDFGKDKYEGDKKVWEDASQAIRDALNEFGAKFVEAEGEAAFYGPKLDVQVRNVLGKEDTIATNQVDILVPHRMGLKYTDSEGKEQTPIILHRAILGSYERFIAFLLEHTAGQLPLWLAPEQVRLAPINDSKEIMDYAHSLKGELETVGLRVSVDGSAESVGKKIRAAGLAKVPYTLVIGEKERESGRVSPRLRQGHGEFEGELSVNEFASALQREVSERAPKSVL